MLARLRQAYIPIFTQITVPYVLLAMLIATGGTFIVTRVIFDSVEERFTNQLIEAALLAKESLVGEEEELLESLRLATNIQGVEEAAVERQSRQLSDLLLPVAFNASVGMLAVLDADGHLLTSVYLNEQNQRYETLVPETPYGDLAFVQNVLAGVTDEAGDKFSGIASTDRGDIFFICGPIRDEQGALAGVVLLGRSVSALAGIVRADTFAQLTFYSLDGTPLATTFSESAPIDIRQAQDILARQDEGSLSRPVTDSGIEYNELLSPWEARAGEDVGLLGVAIPTHILVRASEISRGNSLLLMTASLAMVVVVGLIVARRISVPIRRLKEAATEVAAGNLRVKVPLGGRDEISVLTHSFNDMVDSLSKSKKDLLDAYEKTIEGWARAIDLRDHETENHSRRVADLSVSLAQTMGITGQALVDLRRGALLHDIGKIAIPDKILLKAGSLTKAEMKNMRQHPAFAKSFMEQIEFLKPALVIPYNHHEKWDGTGYPRGLKGEKIPLEARIFAIVDVWDALTSDRPYRKAQGFDEAMNFIESESGKHFDPQVVKAFKKLMVK